MIPFSVERSAIWREFFFVKKRTVSDRIEKKVTNAVWFLHGSTHRTINNTSKDKTEE